MKKNLLVFVFLCFLGSSFSQTLPELPMKNDKIYYVFESSFKNQKKCLGKYSINNLVEQTSMRMGEKLKGRFNKSLDPKEISNLGFEEYNSQSCNDTIAGLYSFILPGGGLKLIDFTVLGRVTGSGKKRTLTNVIQGNALLIFKSNNQYELRIKSFMLQTTYMDMTESNIDLSKYYSELKKKTKVSKNQAKLFSDLDDCLKLNNQSLSESFQFIIENEELD
jgi:hypothetical protein